MKQKDLEKLNELQKKENLSHSEAVEFAKLKALSTKNMKDADAVVNMADLKDAVKEVVSNDMTKKFEEFEANAKKKFYLTENPEDGQRAKQAEGMLESIEFIKALGGGDTQKLQSMNQARKKALNETTGAQGEYLVPAQFDTKVYTYMEQYSQIRNRVTVIPMKGKVIDLNALSVEPIAYYTGELETRTTSSMTFDEPQLKARKLIALVDYSSELREDAEIQLLDFIQQRTARALAKAEQNAILNSTTSGFEGILQDSGLNVITLESGLTSFSDINWDHLADLETAVAENDEVDAEDGIYMFSRSVYNVLRKIRATTTISGDKGNYILPAVPSLKDPASAWGHEILTLNQMPRVSDASQAGKKFALFMNLRNHLLIGDRAGIRVSLHEEGIVNNGSTDLNLLLQDAEVLKVRKRSGYKTFLKNGIGALATNS